MKPSVVRASRIDAPGYAPWWGGHQCQLMYSAFPALEAALRLVPGLYSGWLRLWGSRVACYAHLVKRRDVGLVLYVRRIRIGDGVLLGAGSRLGPGVCIENGAVLPVQTDVGVGHRIRRPP